MSVDITMARKRNKISVKQQDRNTAIMMYARALGLHSISEYQRWCVQYGFSSNLNKTRRQFERERQYYKLLLAKSKLKQHKREGNMHCLVQKIYKNDIKYTELDNAVLKLVWKGFKKTPDKRLLRDVLFQMDEKSRLLRHVDYASGVISFVAHKSMWLRPISEWLPTTRNADRQFSSLSRHLFARYAVPEFMDSVWQKGDKKSKGWFIHIGKGKNIRTARSLPVNMTKKMAHYFIQAPSDYDVNSAFRWAQIHALGGNKEISDAITETRIVRVFNDENFWLTVLRFFIANPMLDTSQYNPIIDYIWHQKYENRMEFVERGVVREVEPEQPGFSMTGRTADTLLRQVDDWHRRLGRELRGGNLQWLKSSIKDFRYVEGRAGNRNMRIWTIRELLRSKELMAEGRTQHHCVATYARSCFTGVTSIWTMDVQDSQTRSKSLTVEIQNQTKTIMQVRGLRNRRATTQEMNVIHRWAVYEEIKLSSYI